ncbi:ATP-binding protein [Streptomyces sp. CA-111067]|uniref:ATP-binding protein n=1 Tax=Streptomyces sp. CA-111067 TaxID=3240046 RepID=UPI003D970117
MLTFGVPLVAMAAAGAGCWWALGRAAEQDRRLVLGAGVLVAVLLGAAIALAMSRRRLSAELRQRVTALHAEAAITVAEHADTARRAALDLEAAQRRVRIAETQRRTAGEAQVSLRAALKSETARAAALEGETARLAEVTVPLAVERLRAGTSADTVLARLPQPTGTAHQRLLGVLVHELGTGERMRAAGLTACASAAGRMQALTTDMLASLREMENRHSEEVLGDLLHLDHCTAQTGRLADSIAVITGARTGRRWTKPIVMESILRGAMGRIDAYRRVKLHSASVVAVAGHAAEGVMHALAELMDNAANFSPPTEEVHVYVQETHSGVVVTIEDAGLAMPDTTLSRAQHLVSGQPQDARALPGTRLGLAVVGRLAGKHGLTVSFRPSSRGGTGVVVLIPPRLLTQPPADFPVPEPQYADPRGGQRSPARSGAADPAAVALPKRPPGQTLAAAEHGEPGAESGGARQSSSAGLAPVPPPSPYARERQDREARARADAGARFTAFRDASLGRTAGERSVGAPAGDDPSGRRRAERATGEPWSPPDSRTGARPPEEETAGQHRAAGRGATGPWTDERGPAGPWDRQPPQGPPSADEDTTAQHRSGGRGAMGQWAGAPAERSGVDPWTGQTATHPATAGPAPAEPWTAERPGPQDTEHPADRPTGDAPGGDTTGGRPPGPERGR